MSIVSVQKRWQSLVLAAALIVTSVTTALTNSVFATAGDIQPWQTAAYSLPVGSSGGGSVELNGYLYVLGGTTDSTVQYSYLDSNGQTGQWRTTTSLPAPITVSSAFTKNGYIYVAGHNYSGIATDYGYGLFYAKANGDGTLGNWHSESMPVRHDGASSIIAGNYLYIIGGGTTDNSDPDNPITNLNPPVSYAELKTDGSIGNWQTTTALPGTVGYLNIAENNGYIYAIGGVDTTSSSYQPASSAIYYAHINNDGSLSSWSTSSKSLPDPRASSATVILDNYLYVIGGSPANAGYPSTNTVFFSHINNDGSFDDWQLSDTPLPTVRSGNTGVLVNNTIYSVGGYSLDSEGNTPPATAVYFTSITPQTIAAPTNLTAATPTNQKPALSWTGVSGATSYTVYRNGTAVGTSTTNSFTDSALATDGNYTYTVTASNGSLTSVQSAPLTVQYDATRPTATGAAISGWLVIHWGNPTISANVSDNLSGVTGGEYYIDTDPGQGNGKPMTYSNGKINATVTISSGANGIHTIYMRSKDAAGNWSTTTSVQYLYVL